MPIAQPTNLHEIEGQPRRYARGKVGGSVEPQVVSNLFLARVGISAPIIGEWGGLFRQLQLMV